MTTKAKNVSRRYAISEFRTTGLVLILYCLFVLYIPLLIKDFSQFLGEYTIFGLDIYPVAHFFCLIFGTLIPFFILKLARVNKKKKEPIRVGLKELMIDYVVFFAGASAAIFFTMMLAQYINVNGELVTSIGLVLSEEYMTNIVYVIAFIFVTPIIEEFAFRDSLLNFLSKYGKYFAAGASSLIYALAHGSFVEMIPAFFMGYVLCKLSLRYKSIKPCIFVHILFNATYYALFLIPERFGMYTAFGLAIICVLAVVLLVTKSYRFVTIRKSDSNKQIILLFVSTYTVTIAIVLFVIHSITQLLT